MTLAGTGAYNWGIIIALMFFIVGGGYLYIVMSTYFNVSKTKMRRDYMFVNVSLALYSVFHGLMTAADDETRIWGYWALGFVSISMFFPLWFKFLLNIIAPESRLAKIMSKNTIR